MGFFEDTRTKEEVEKAVDELRGTEEKQTSLREDGFASIGDETNLGEFDDE